MSRERLHELWTRHLAGPPLSPAEEGELLDALRRDPVLRDELLDDKELDGLLDAALHPDDGDAFATAFAERLEDEKSATRFIRSVESALRPGATRRSRRRAARRDASPFLPIAAAVAAAAVLLGLVALSSPRRAPAPPRVPLAVEEPLRAPAPELLREAQAEAEARRQAAAERLEALARERERLLEERRRADAAKVEDLRRKAEEELGKVAAEVQQAREGLRAAERQLDESPPAPPAPSTTAEAGGPAFVEALDGFVLALDGDRRTPLAEGDRLAAGRGVEVPAGGRIVFAFADRTRIELGPDSLLDSLREDGGKKLVLRKGDLRAEVARQPADRPLVIATPHGEATVLGTTLRLRVGDEATRLEVVEGRVRLSRERKAVDVPSGAYAVAQPGADLVARPLPIDEIVLSARRGKIAGGAWQFAKDARTSTGIALEAAREGAFEFNGERMVALSLRSYVDFEFDADAGRDYRVWVRGRTLADPSLPDTKRMWHDSVVLEAPTGSWSRPCAWMTDPAFARMHRFDGYRSRNGYWWLGGNHEPRIAGGEIGDGAPVSIRFSKPGRQKLRLYCSEAPVRIDAIWLSTTQDTRPEDVNFGRARK